MSLSEQQLKYEVESDGNAAASRLKELSEAALAGDADAPRAKRLTGEMYKTVHDLLQNAIDVKTRGTGGKYKTWMRRLGAEKAALIAIRECIRRIQSGQMKGKPTSAQKLCCEVGRLYETEVRIIEAEEVNPMYMERIHEQVKANASQNIDHLRRLYNVAYDRVMKGELDSTLPDTDLVQIGKFGVDACYQAGLIKMLPQQSMSMTFYTIDDEVADYLTGYDQSDVHNVVDRGAGAMMCPPQEWTNLRDGGYLSPRRKQAFPLMITRKLRRSERARIREEFTAERMPVVFACANYLQSIPYEMHMPTFRAIERIWASGGNTMGMPRREKPVKPASPFAEGWDKETASEDELKAFSAWKREATAYYTGLKEWRGHVLEFGGFMKMAKRAGQPLWFPVMMDTRGRWYYNGTPNPQGSDMAKATLHFHDKKPLGKRGVFWLKVHIANSLGFDKVRMRERAAYVESIWSRLEAALDAPEEHVEVWGTDSPWCAYSAAWELREALRTRNPELYETGIPIHMDATCSGLQHFSAMLRDPVGGQFVNLFDAGGEQKQDIYRKTSEVAMEAILRGAEGVPRDFWQEAGISRSQAKKPVMTYVYGATLRGTQEFLEEEALAGRDDTGKEKGERNCDIAVTGAKALFSGIEGTVPAAANAMRWLKDVCRTVPKNSRMEWTAPTGFKVQHDYQKIEEVRVRINCCGVNRVLVHDLLDECNPQRMQNAIAPNFVHALDASHLTFVALNMKNKGKSFVGIHDSFGTHPCDVDEMQMVIREEFVQMYTKHDVLADFLWEVGGLGSVPKKGTLDLQKVLYSEFFFC